MSNTETNNTGSSKAPSHIVYHVRDGSGEKSFWTRIGVAWPHKDGQGFSVQIACVPLDGRLSIRIASDKKE